MSAPFGKSYICEDCGEEFTEELHKCIHVTGSFSLGAAL